MAIAKNSISLTEAVRSFVRQNTLSRLRTITSVGVEKVSSAEMRLPRWDWGLGTRFLYVLCQLIKRLQRMSDLVLC